MRMYDIILKKRQGGVLTKEETEFFVNGYTTGEIPDYQASALLMAIMFQNMTKEETAILTMSMAKSGDMLDLSEIEGIKVDKHSTGGVGDKVSLVVGPIVAASGVPVAKMSGRGLGHTGGTVDKLEAIPGFKTELTTENFINQVKNINLAVIGQTGDIAPADKKLYALRDVTATVDNVPLIAASVMSKKLAAGADAFLLDVKLGSGAFAKTLDFAKDLAENMVSIAKKNGKEAKALITNMDQPLGIAIGNSLEIIEVAETLQNKGPEDLTELSLIIAAHMLVLAKKGSLSVCKELAKETLETGRAFEKFLEMVKAQQGSTKYLRNTDLFPKALSVKEYRADKEGYVTKLDTEKIGLASVSLGAGRAKKEDVIDNSAGIKFCKKINSSVKKGDTIATLYAAKESLFAEATELLDNAVIIGDTPVDTIPLVYEVDIIE